MGCDLVGSCLYKLTDLIAEASMARLSKKQWFAKELVMYQHEDENIFTDVGVHKRISRKEESLPCKKPQCKNIEAFVLLS